MFKKILVAVDGSGPAGRALEVGLTLAWELRSQVMIVHVVDMSVAILPELGIVDQKRLERFRSDGEAIIRHAMDRVPSSLHAEHLIVEGDPADMILDTAHDWIADVIVLGSDSRGRLAHFLVGSTADTVIRRALCPVLSVRQEVGTCAVAAATRENTVA